MTFKGDRLCEACPGCAYDLAGVAPGLCPECGRPFTARELRKAALTGVELWSLLVSASRWTVVLWSAMFVGLVTLMVFEGGALVGWAIAGAFPGAGALIGMIQTRVVAIKGARHRHAPSVRLRLLVMTHTGVAMLLGVPVMGVAGLLVLGAILGKSLGP